MALPASLLGVALASVGLLDVGVRSEVRGLRGNEHVTGPSGPITRSLADPVPYEIDPWISAAIEEPQQYALRLGYTERLQLLAQPGSTNVVDAAAFGTLSLAAGWQPSERFRLNGAGSLSRGSLQITPTAQLAAPGTVDPGATVQTGRAVAVTPYGAAAVHFDSSFAVTHSLSVGAATGFASGGASRAADRTYFPPQETLTVEASATGALSPRDTLAFKAKFSRTDVFHFGVGGLLDTGLRWDGNLTPETSVYVGGGAAATLFATLAAQPTGDVATAQDRVAPFFEAGAAQVAPRDRPGFGGGVAVAYAPYIDPFTAAVQKRGTLKGTLAWQPVTRWRFTGQAAAGAFLKGYRPLYPSWATELTAWYLDRGGDLGLAFRTGYTEVPGADATATAPPVAGVALWEWGVSLVARWGWRTEL